MSLDQTRNGLAFAALLASAWLLGCGGGVALLHPAQTLAPGQTSFGAGMSDRLVLGAERQALDAAQRRLPGTPPAPNDPRYARGVLVALAEGPALAPWASARMGIAGSNEAGLSYTGQALRVDARHAFEWDQSAVSLGLGLTGRDFGHSALELPGADLNRAGGFGFDLPVLYGYHTDADLISVWAGVRGGYDHWSGNVSLDTEGPYVLRAGRLSAGPLLGLAVGLSPIWVAAELEVDYSHVTGSLDRGTTRYDTQVDGWSVHPAGALIAKF